MSREHDAGILAERVYNWAVNDLGYHPDTTDTLAASPFVTNGLTSQNTRLANTFQPQDIYPLCNGPLGSVFEHLIVNIRPRAHRALKIRSCKGGFDMRMDIKGKKRTLDDKKLI
ncbi:hypothetical protein DFQ27_007132 [Actinomortierella ambigua]|uniref:Uncharacterized protein n=1 Tax=Actinomortierella ambigua TaxID=1343610 RepID=A0A9P6QKG2_9FUNG|nr:hypothetical protein DFQ27_007132 [Actinomortierella ambigua]